MANASLNLVRKGKKKTIIIQEVVEAKINLSLSLEEVVTLVHVLYNIGGPPESPRKYMDNILDSLKEFYNPSDMNTEKITERYLYIQDDSLPIVIKEAQYLYQNIKKNNE